MGVPGGRSTEYGEGNVASAHSTSGDARISSNRWVFEFTSWNNSDQKVKKSAIGSLGSLFSGAATLTGTTLL